MTVVVVGAVVDVLVEGAVSLEVGEVAAVSPLVTVDGTAPSGVHAAKTRASRTAAAVLDAIG